MVSPDPLQLPQKPGCYFFKDTADKIIYIGKAKNLRKRVSSYFTKKHIDSKTTHLVEHIHSIEHIITKNEVEALLLESNLIKKHTPQYNIELKYSLRYAWIVLTDEIFPRLLTARTKSIPGEYFGPFTSGQLRRTLIETLQKRFFIRSCKTFPKKPCLRYHIETCRAPCVKYQSEKKYNQYVDKVRSYLRGNNKSLIKILEREMYAFSSKQEYEKAKERKEQISALEYLQKRILVENNRLEEQDVISYYTFVDSNDTISKTYLIVFSFRNGILEQRQEFTIAGEEDVLDEFIKRYYENTPLPSEIIIPQPLQDESIKEYLSEKAKRKITITIPQKGLKKELLDMAKQNLSSKFSNAITLANDIQQHLSLETPVRTIECFDISHLSGSEMVGAMSYFEDGKPVKEKYRKFKIRTVDGIDDFRAIEEVVRRRYKRLLDEKKEFPDLILIDGGRIQVDFAMKALHKLGVSIPLIGIAKKYEEIYFPKEVVAKRFDKNTLMIKTLIQARDEAHRFGITYHKLLRSKRQKRE
ncbi:MAG: excinuclease ABC subunit UvrC [Nanobdellota archaeon]